MAPPLRWNTLEEASIWLSEKTKEKWTSERIINFSIDQCRPDNIIEDYKYPSYLQTILPESTSDYLTWVSLRLDDSSLAYVREGIQFREKEIKTTFIFRDNLIELASLGKTAIHYVSYNDQPHTDSVIEEKEKSIIVYCELRPLILDLEKPYPKFPSIPIIHINFETIGIRDEELKQLLCDYLALPKQVPVKRNTELNEKQMDKASCQDIAKTMWEKNPNLTQAEIINHEKLKFYKMTYKGKNTLPGWLREIDPRPKELRRGRPKKYPST